MEKDSLDYQKEATKLQTDGDKTHPRFIKAVN